MKKSFIVLVSVLVAGRFDGLAAEPGIVFEKDVKPILEFHCVACHDANETKGGLRFDEAGLFFEGGDGGPALVKGEPDESLLIELVSLPADDIDVMPPKGRTLNEVEIGKLRQWIKEGADWPEQIKLVARDEEDFKGAEPLEDLGKDITKIEVFPPDLNLEKARDSQSMVVMATYEDDTTREVTANAAFEFEDPALIALKTRNHFTPAKDGTTTLNVTVGPHRVGVPVKVTEAAVDRPISFNLDVMPVFMAEGCNTGACHGSARGQDGFMLSLFGYDPDGDHYRLTREMAGHRVNLAIPEESLLVEKSIETVPHTGGKLMEKDSHGYNTMVEWIADGAKNDNKDEILKVTGIEVYPPKLVLEGAGTEQQLTVRATYSDGHDRDVTHLAVFITNNEPSANVDEFGKVTAGKRGEAFIMARYDTFTVGIQTIVIPEGLEYTRSEMTENNYVDEYVHDKLHKLRITPSGTCSDEEFLRRVSLDITGQLPTPERYHAFVADKRPNKRSLFVDELLERKEFTEMWVMKWSELLQIRSDNNINLGISYKSALLYNGWLRDRIAANDPFNEIVNDLIASKGGTFSSPETNFYQVERDSLKLSENVAQVFMGMRLQCAQCHNHPFDRWTMDDYYGWAAFFSQIGRKQGVDQREQLIYNRGSGEVKHLVGGHVMEPKFLGGEKPDVKGKDRRAVLANWLASPENPYFARNVVNVVWSHFFGVGIIDPVDDVRVSNPASNPELLSALASRFEGEYQYDFRQIVRDICNSATYQRSTKANPSNKDDMNNFAKARIRRQRAEVLLDTITQVTETQNKFRGLPLGARAVQIADGRTTDYFLTTFGRATRETVCSCEVKMDPSLSQALHLMNGPTVTQKIESGKAVRELIEAGKKPEEVIEDLYIRALTRRPTGEEKKQLMAQVNAAKGDPQEVELVLNDVFWAILNSKEFMFNH
ncbi:MAG: PSD1 and planctomycete cytochrome C domain-containing protein [Verrucomicrobiota bacterium]